MPVIIEEIPAIKFDNECPHTLESINSDIGVMVISYNKKGENNAANLSYYNSQKDFKEAWNAQNNCPVTENTHYILIPLNSLSDAQIKSLVKNPVDGEPKELKSGGINDLDNDCYAKILFNQHLEKNIIPSRKVQKILDGFQTEIATIGDHHQQSKEKEKATTLHQNLIELAEKTFKNPTPENLTHFKSETKRLIQEATPVLQKDLGWGDYLSNLTKEICNFIGIAFGRKHGFFSTKNSKATEAANQLNEDLEKAQDGGPSSVLH